MYRHTNIQGTCQAEKLLLINSSVAVRVISIYEAHYLHRCHHRDELEQAAPLEPMHGSQARHYPDKAVLGSLHHLLPSVGTTGPVEQGGMTTKLVT